ncbi:CDP-diacylglycerol--glycerol-3-phosphate 3-phosphatidyltransferase [Euzebya sp.]|uniref:CDP-diacylglycerol--glycerol-3-phosphate 3-phosphatidyltransferase n=1 Tax=Euzebya sp. TaxID=1971409 RepID=UPI00351317A6
MEETRTSRSAPRPPSGDHPAEPSPFNLANAFTFLRVLLVPVIGWLLATSAADASGATPAARWWAFGIFTFAAATDTIDGEVARRLVGVTRWGQLADPLADKLLIIGALAILAALGELPWWAVGVIVAREAAVTWLRARLVRDRGVVMPASSWGKVKTVTQVAAVTLYLYPGIPDPVREAALVIAVVATVGSGLEYAVRIQRRSRAEVGGEGRGGG